MVVSGRVFWDLTLGETLCTTMAVQLLACFSLEISLLLGQGDMKPFFYAVSHIFLVF